jgi:cell division protease FtsH
MALGVTQQTPGVDKHLLTRPELESRLQVLMGGYAAEVVVLGECSSGAENDLKRATELALKMVAHYGMSERIGPVFHEHRTEHAFLGRIVGTDGGTSDATVHVLEDESRKILAEALVKAKSAIVAHRAPLERLVAALLATETLGRAELERLLGSVGNGAAPRAAATADESASHVSERFARVEP